MEEKGESKSKGDEEVAKCWGVRRCYTNDRDCTFWNRDTNAARNILNLFLCSAQGKQRPEPFRRKLAGPTPQTQEAIPKERFIRMRIGELQAGSQTEDKEGQEAGNRKRTLCLSSAQELSRESPAA